MHGKHFCRHACQEQILKHFSTSRSSSYDQDAIDRYAKEFGLGPGLYLMQRDMENAHVWVRLSDVEHIRQFWANCSGLSCDVETRPCSRLGPGQFGVFAKRPLAKEQIVCTFDAGGVVQFHGQGNIERFVYLHELPSTADQAAITKERNEYKFTSALPTSQITYHVYGNPLGTCPGPIICEGRELDACNCAFSVYIHVARNGRAVLRTTVFTICAVEENAEMFVYCTPAGSPPSF